GWGWRVAFLFGLVIATVVLIVRRRLPPDAVIVNIAEQRHSPVVTAFATQWHTILKIMCVVLALGIGFYLNFVYLSTWLVEYADISHAEALALKSVALGLRLPLRPRGRAVSDRFGARAVLLTS